MTRGFHWTFCGLVGLVLIGCSGEDVKLNLAAVKGKVTYGDNPVGGAMVTFTFEGAPRLSVGETDVDGNYQLTMFEKNDGAVIGQNAVTISSSAVAGSVPTTSEGYEKMMGIGKKPPPKGDGPTAIPAKYADTKKPPFKVNVTAGKNQHDFKLQD